MLWWEYLIYWRLLLYVPVEAQQKQLEELMSKDISEVDTDEGLGQEETVTDPAPKQTVVEVRA